MIHILCREHLPAGATAQPFERVNRSRERRLTDDPYQHPRLFLPVYIAFSALRTAIAVRQLLVLDIHLPRTTKRPCSIAAVPRERCRVVIRLRSGLGVFLLPNHRTG